jgi:hypothetical protein
MDSGNREQEGADGRLDPWSGDSGVAIPEKGRVADEISVRHPVDQTLPVLRCDT